MSRNISALIFFISLSACAPDPRMQPVLLPGPSVSALPLPPQDPASPSIPTTPIGDTSRAAIPAIPQSPDCRMRTESIHLREGILNFPREGRFAIEAHYATDSESFGLNDRPFPRTPLEALKWHLTVSCWLLRSFYGFDLEPDCREVYRSSLETRWTPPEGGGGYGQAARGELKPEWQQELWQGNFMYAQSSEIPEPGTRYIVQNPKNHASVVVSFGFEVGPEQPRWLGGLTAEAHWVLGSLENESVLLIGRAIDQRLPYGPVHCQVGND